MKLRMDIDKWTAEAVMIIFAFVSLANVRQFFIGAGHDELVSWTLGLALGAVLLTIGRRIVRVDRHQDHQAFVSLLVAGILFGTISGAIQAAEYAKHLNLLWALALGLSIPIGGEIVLPLALSQYAVAVKRQTDEAKAQKEAELVENLQTRMKQQAASHVAAAVEEYDHSTLARYIQRHMDTTMKEAAAAVFTELRELYVVTDNELVKDTELDVISPIPNAEMVGGDSTSGLLTDDQLEQGREKAHTSKRTAAQERRVKVLDYLRTLNGQPVKVINRTRIGEQFGCRRQTIADDLEQLQQSGAVSLNGVVQVRG